MRPIELNVQDTINALLSTGQCDPFIKDQFSCTVFHIWKASKSSLQLLSQQYELQLANLSLGECQDMLFTRIWTSDWPNQTSMALDILPKSSNRSKILANFAPDSETYMEWRDMGSLLSILASLTVFFDYGKSVVALLVDFIASGSDLHALSSLPTSCERTGCALPITILFVLLFTLASERYSERQRKKITRKWLNVLVLAKVDLLEYGAEEISMHAKGETSWVFATDLEGETGGSKISAPFKFSMSTRQHLLQIGE
jgi:hypothetical protein